jgi:hypothetical protein
MQHCGDAQLATETPWVMTEFEQRRRCALK